VLERTLSLSSGCAAAIALALALSGCRRAPTGPDPSYRGALQLYQQLYATELDDAYADPKMDEVIRALRATDPRSDDAEAATSLLGTIERGRAALAKERAERAARQAAAAASAVSGPAIDVGNFLPPPAPEDAGPPQDPFGPGASIAKLNASSGACLVAGEPFKEQGTNTVGTVYRLASPTCAQKLPGLAGQAMLVVGDKIYRRVPDFAPAGPAVEDAGPPPRPAAQPSAPADAGQVGEYRQYYMGQPIPVYETDAGP
jgi:hypothetical protein